MILDLGQEAQLVQLGDDGLAGGEALHPGELGRQGGVIGGAGVAIGIDHFGLGTHVGVQGEDVDHRQVVALAHFVVVEVVGRGDFHAAGALSMSACSSATMGIRRFTSGSRMCWPISAL